MRLKKQYKKPEFSVVVVDKSITLVMMTMAPPNPMPRGGGSKGTNTPFSSPFDDKPFS